MEWFQRQDHELSSNPSQKYRPTEGHYDEALAPSGMPRRHWRKLSTALVRMGEKRLGRRWQNGIHLIQSNGVTYNVYGDPQGSQRPWPLDPIPLVISSQEWSAIETAVIQRATLLNAILSDIYGEQSLLHERRFPAELVLENPGFLRPCHGVPVSRNVFLTHFAVDLARSPDGQWWVIADRTQAPSGAGYALENRLVCAQTLPEAFHRSRVRQLARFFQSFREGLASLSLRNRDNPRVVLLTPGPYNETFFEHAYLAKHLGYTLVEGPDLTVRGDHVYLKTLGGLEPVDVILRRLDDGYCDPLELRGDSLLGVAGLVHAVRSGHVAIANALGAGLMETSAHMAFLPGLCRHMLGEELKLPSVATWWCGQDQPLRYVEQNLERLVIKPAFPRFGLKPVFGAALSAEEREAFTRKVEAHPWQYVAQEQVALSTAPVWTETGIEPRHVVMRVFASWSNGGYVVMPGGLTRISQSAESLVVTMQRGGGSKDTWVLSEQDDEPFALPQPSRGPVDITRSTDLPSRVADNLFWLGRYVERAESQVRIARALVPALSGECDLGGAVSIESAITLLAGYRYVAPEMIRTHPSEQLRSLERALLTVLFDAQRPAGLLWTVNQVGRIAWQLKERLSTDTWRVLNQLEKDFQRTQPPTGVRLLAELEPLDKAIVTLSAFSGLMMESMTRGQGWRFLDMGRRLERALQMIELLGHGLVPGKYESLETLLRVADSSITYRSRYYTNMQPDLVLDLLLADESNPRSVAFQFTSLAAHIEELPQQDGSAHNPLESRLILKILTAVRLLRSDDLAVASKDGERTQLRHMLAALQFDLESLADAISRKYLSHAMPSRLVASS